MRGDLIRPQSFNPGDIVVLPPEAEAIAREAATRYAATLEPDNAESRGLPVIVTAHPAEMRYELDSDYALRRLWRVTVLIDGPAATAAYVSVSPETGEVIGVKSALVRSSNGIRFVLCDAAIAVTKEPSGEPEGIEDSVYQCDTAGSEGSPTNVWVNGECQLEPLLCANNRNTQLHYKRP